ncbi:MAG: YlxR family protein [Clostridia bacterium]|nr:YlxR family protein [Clostridia bacterium]
MKPERMCTVCREMKDKDKLIRIAKTDTGFLLDTANKGGGRGAYICKDKACISVARKRSAFERSFSCKIPLAIYDDLEELTGDE